MLLEKRNQSHMLYVVWSKDYSLFLQFLESSFSLKALDEKKSNLLISKFYNLIKGKIKIIGVGGVDSGKAAYDKFLLGADYVQLYTGMVFQGPNIAGMIKKDLKELLIRDGVKNFTEIVGNKTVS